MRKPAWLSYRLFTFFWLMWFLLSGALQVGEMGSCKPLEWSGWCLLTGFMSFAIFAGYLSGRESKE